MNEKFIIASPAGDAGLCNRIKCIVSVSRLAEHSGQKMLLHWPTSFTCGARFSDLFDNKIQQISDKEMSKIRKGINFLDCISYNDFINNNKKYSIFNAWRFVLLPSEVQENFAKVFPENDGRYIDLEYERIPQDLRKEFLKCIKKLVPAKGIRNNLRKFSKKYEFRNIVGVHARRTEFLLNADGRGGVSSDERFFERMHEILKEKPPTKFFLATDSKETEQNFIREFGDKIIVFTGKNWDKSSKESIQHALIDLLLLARTKHILGTYLSTFTEIAWWLGGCKAKVEIIGQKEDKQKVLERYKKITNQSVLVRMVRKPLKFLRARFKIFRWVIEKILYYKNKS
ncbi:hypothetical protein HYT26_00045 [Candidatus Pacearchaeota archaeon]|nr:hypothetical protein [Candidatus Pacearchaeota archaeon]